MAREIGDLFKDYGKVFKKYGVTLCNMGQLQSDIDNGKVKMIVKHDTFQKSGSRWVLATTETEEMEAYNYLCIVSAIPVFKDRVEKTHTKYGFIPTYLSCISWGTGDTKAVREIKFEEV